MEVAAYGGLKVKFAAWPKRWRPPGIYPHSFKWPELSQWRWHR